MYVNDDTIENPHVALYEAQRVAMVNWETVSEDPSSDEEMEDSSADEEMEGSFASEMSSDFGDIFQYERDLSYDAFQCSTPVAAPVLCSAHVTIRSSPLPLLLSTIALQSILPPFNSTCNQLYALQRAVRIERAAPGHPARPPQLQRTSPPERASSWLPAPLRLYSSGVYKSSTSTAQQCRAVPFSSAAPQRTLPLQHRSFP
jgi:hypothetical protein